MKGLEIKNKIESALSEVLKNENDAYLLQKDIHERTIAHKLATYLQSEFKNYNVDVEYNGNVLREDGRKKFEAFKDELQLCGRLRKKEEKIDEEIIERDAYPDIIIHKRGTRENLCIIEIKKSTSTVSCKYDKLKLERYTSRDIEKDPKNYLKYELGVFITFCAGRDFFDRGTKPKYTLEFYKNGEKIPEKTLVSIANLTDA